MDFRFSSTDREYLEKFLAKEGDVIIKIKDNINSTQLHNHMKIGSESVYHLTLLEKITVYLLTLPNKSVDSKDIYAYNFWYEIHNGADLVCPRNEWSRVDNIRSLRVFAETRLFHKFVLEAATSIYPRKIVLITLKELLIF